MSRHAGSHSPPPCSETQHGIFLEEIESCHVHHAILNYSWKERNPRCGHVLVNDLVTQGTSTHQRSEFAGSQRCGCTENGQTQRAPLLDQGFGSNGTSRQKLLVSKRLCDKNITWGIVMCVMSCQFLCCQLLCCPSAAEVRRKHVHLENQKASRMKKGFSEYENACFSIENMRTCWGSLREKKTKIRWGRKLHYCFAQKQK